MKPYRFGLTFAILASLTLLLLLTWFLVSLISFKTAENDLISQKNEEARILLSSFIHLLPANPAENDPAAARRFAGIISGEQSFVGIALVDKQGEKQFELGWVDSKDARLGAVMKTGGESWFFSREGKVISRYAPLKVGGKVEGAAALTLTLHKEYERLSRSQRIFLLYFILDFILLLGFGSYLLSRFIVVPIRRLLSATERVASGDLHYRSPVAGAAEISDLGEAFNNMVSALKEKRDAVERHVESLEGVNRELKTARHEIVRSEKMASIGLLAAGTAHEIGTPLAAIMGYAAMLREELDQDAEKSEFVQRIESESERIDRIIRSLLDYARTSPSSMGKVNVPEVLGGTLEMLEDQGALKKIEKSVMIGSEVVPVMADSQELRQVFANLIINARDAMPEGGRLSIRVLMAEPPENPQADSARSSAPMIGRRKEDFGGAFIHRFNQMGRYIKIEFRDTGEGIEAKDLDRIFDPFFTTKEPGHGTGLGLAISARIIDTFGGRISVESERGKGSTFTVWLPAIDQVPEGEK